MKIDDELQYFYYKKYVLKRKKKHYVSQKKGIFDSKVAIDAFLDQSIDTENIFVSNY